MNSKLSGVAATHARMSVSVVDSFALTANKCKFSTDGRHYAGLVFDELLALCETLEGRLRRGGRRRDTLVAVSASSEVRSPSPGEFARSKKVDCRRQAHITLEDPTARGGMSLLILAIVSVFLCTAGMHWCRAAANDTCATPVAVVDSTRIGNFACIE